MPIPRTEFVQKVWDALGATGKTDFARKLGLGPDGLQKVRRWQKGGRLDYEDIMVMLERTGWFAIGAPGVRVSDPPSHPEGLEDVLVALHGGQVEALSELDELRELLVEIRGMLDARLPTQRGRRGTA